MPVVDAGGSGCAITMSANGCILQGFKTVNSGIRKDAGIYVKSHNNVVSGNNANSNCGYGISTIPITTGESTLMDQTPTPY